MTPPQMCHQFISEREVPSTYVLPPRELGGHPLPTAKVTPRNQHSESSGRSTSGCGMQVVPTRRIPRHTNPEKTCVGPQRSTLEFHEVCSGVLSKGPQSLRSHRVNSSTPGSRVEERWRKYSDPSKKKYSITVKSPAFKIPLK